MRRGAGWGVLPVAAFYVFFCAERARQRVYFFPQLAGCFDSDESRDINLRPSHPGRRALRLHPHRTLRKCTRKGCSLCRRAYTISRIHLFAAGATNFSLRLSCVFSCALVIARRASKRRARRAFPAKRARLQRAGREIENESN